MRQEIYFIAGLIIEPYQPRRCCAQQSGTDWKTPFRFCLNIWCLLAHDDISR